MEKEIAALVFVACMFIGSGVALLFGRLDVGGAVGMSAGFLTMAFLRARKIEPIPVTISLPRSFGQISLCVVGVLVIARGLTILYKPELLYPYVAGILRMRRRAS